MSHQAYTKVLSTKEDPRQTEYRLFAQVTGNLMRVRDAGKRDHDFFDALDWNRRLWSTLSTDCATEGNALPDQLRAGIVSLAIWVSKHTSQVARGNEDIGDLIRINKTIMEGLATQPGQTAAPRPSASAYGEAAPAKPEPQKSFGAISV